MKRLLALIVALMMALTCAASAQTQTLDLIVNKDAVKNLMSGFGMSEDQMAMADPVIALLDALGVKLVSAGDGGEVTLSLNGADAVTVGFGATESEACIASTLIPNYLLTVKRETISEFMNKFMAQMAGGMTGGEGGIDMAALQEKFSAYLTPWMEAVTSAAQPGEPVQGSYELEGHTFDVMIPVSVDMPAIVEATRTMVDGILADESLVGALQSMGENFNVDDIKAGMDEWMAHFPDTVNAEVYANSDGSQTTYMIAESSREGEEAPFFTCSMLMDGPGKVNMGFTMTMDEGTIQGAFAQGEEGVSMSLDMNGLYMGLSLADNGSGVACDLFFMDPNAPLVSLIASADEGGARTLSLDAEGKTVLAVEDLLEGTDSEAAQGLMGDLMMNGLGSLLGTVSTQVPELSGILGMLTGMAA